MTASLARAWLWVAGLRYRSPWIAALLGMGAALLHLLLHVLHIPHGD
jgi:hypothetical protein